MHEIKKFSRFGCRRKQLASSAKVALAACVIIVAGTHKAHAGLFTYEFSGLTNASNSSGIGTLIPDNTIYTGRIVFDDSFVEAPITSNRVTGFDSFVSLSLNIDGFFSLQAEDGDFLPGNFFTFIDTDPNSLSTGGGFQSGLESFAGKFVEHITIRASSDNPNAGGDIFLPFDFPSLSGIDNFVLEFTGFGQSIVGDHTNFGTSASAILDTFNEFGELPGEEVPGIFELPDGSSNFVLFFDGIGVGPQPIIIDPDYAFGYEYTIIESDQEIFFETLLLPQIGDSVYQILIPDDAGNILFFEVMAGEIFDFTNMGFDVVSFLLEGIEESAMVGVDDERGFPAMFTFTNEGVIDLEQRAIPFSASDIPEPATLALLSLGLGSLLFGNRCRRSA